jgi:hypothetical protein
VSAFYIPADYIQVVFFASAACLFLLEALSVANVQVIGVSMFTNSSAAFIRLLLCNLSALAEGKVQWHQSSPCVINKAKN